MQRRIRPARLFENNYGTNYPAPTTRTVDVTALNGGLNLWDLPYKLDYNQSPDLLNVYWNDGCLSSRQGQEYVVQPYSNDTIHVANNALWEGYIIFHKDTHLYAYNKSDNTVSELRQKPEEGQTTGAELTVVDADGGHFFTYNAKVYFIGNGDYVYITHEDDGTPYVTSVEAYVPLTIVNRTPSGTGGSTNEEENRLSPRKRVQFSGDGTAVDYILPDGYKPIDQAATSVSVLGDSHTYQEFFKETNTARLPCPALDYITYYRITSGSNTKWYNASSSRQATAKAKILSFVGSFTVSLNESLFKDKYGSTGEHVYTYDGTAWSPSLDQTGITVNGTPVAGDSITAYKQNYEEVSSPGTSVLNYLYWVGKDENGKFGFHFNTAPAQGTSNVEVEFAKTNQDAYDSIMNCKAFTVYGADKAIGVVCGGTPKQPNAYFWSGSNDIGLDPTYFPMENYNYASSNSYDYITGFGKQQNLLVVFQEHSIGKTTFNSEISGEEEYLKMSYSPINETTGCDVPCSIQLIQNNLVFANTYGGVYYLSDSSAYGENTVVRISRNINGDATRGILKELATGYNSANSYDDGKRYVLCVNEKAYLYDYTLSSLGTKEENKTWFLFNGIKSKQWIDVDGVPYQITTNNAIAKYSNSFSDYGQAFSRKYKFATMAFGTYAQLKDILKVVLAVRSDTESTINITYETDYETRADQTPIHAYSWHLVPRNLAMRCLAIVKYAFPAVRTPRCFHVKHFSMTLENNTINTDMSVIQAQIFYRFVRSER